MIADNVFYIVVLHTRKHIIKDNLRNKWQQKQKNYKHKFYLSPKQKDEMFLFCFHFYFK